ncbi:MAG TPA: DUF5615 family PIN-like protein [Candidatus Binatia bacterium]|nr:DUF5615 family PIN-like protein [Candidatus Binatia bacterium]
MSHALVRGLRARGVDVRTALEEGMIERDDEEHLEFAAKANRVLYSFNVADFYDLHSTYLADDKEHAGLILARQQQFVVGEQLRRLLRLIAKVPADEMKNRVEFLGAWS